MKRIEKMFLILLTAAAIQAVSVANAHADEHGELMTQLDSDQDGLISLKEAVRNTELLRNFGLIDQNEDGLLSMDELLASELTPSGQRMES